MKRKNILLCRLLAAVLVCLCFSGYTATGEETFLPENKAEWTVLFYMCGSDLESRYGYGSDNLREIAACEYPSSIFMKVAQDRGYDRETALRMMREYNIYISDDVIPSRPVNILVETGGAREWHARDLGMDIDTGSLQRWRYCLGNNPDGEEAGFVLEETLPLASMSRPETLEDFIRWGTQAYPAQKYMLVLWGHGGGSKTGIFIDELFDGDVMHLDELGQAMTGGGTQFEAVLFDACMMANMETAWHIRNSARWMIASQEVVPGHGTNITGWLQELINNSRVDGKQLGRCICDMTQIKYSDVNDKQAQSILTWSVIDLSKAERLANDMGSFMHMFSVASVAYPELSAVYADSMYNAERYTLGEAGMKDIASVLYSKDAVKAMDVNMRNELVDALSEAVVYNLRGAARSRSWGLSFCFAFGFTSEELDVFVRNCPNASYLALLDALHPEWTAPDWVYEQTDRLPELAETDNYRPKLEKRRRSNGMPGLFVRTENRKSVLEVRYRLYRYNEELDQAESLGENICRGIETEDGVLWSAIAPGYWWAVDNVPCCVNVVNADDTQCVYNIPIRIGTELWYLRCLREYERILSADAADTDVLSTNSIYGLWEGYEDQSDSSKRNIMSLAEMAGREYSLLYPIHDGERDTYAFSTPKKLNRAVTVEEKPLPAGTYYLEYLFENRLLRSTVLDRVEMYWDGAEWSYPEGFTWEGEIAE